MQYIILIFNVYQVEHGVSYFVEKNGRCYQQTWSEYHLNVSLMTILYHSNTVHQCVCRSVNFGTVVQGHDGRNILKICKWEIHVTHLNIFLIFQL